MRSAELVELERHRRALLHVALRLYRGRPEEANDLVQDTYTRVLENAHRMPDTGGLRAWLVTVLMNLFHDRYRRDRRMPPPLLVDTDQLVADEVAHDPEPPWERVTIAAVRAALQELDGRVRRVFEMFEFENRSYKEIAEELGLPMNTVGGTLFKARQKLRAILHARCPPEADGGGGAE